MKRVGILTAGGDTPALNATIYGAIQRANQLRIEMVGFIKGYTGLVNPRIPHVFLNPLFQPIPELDPTYGGTIIGSSREYVDRDNDVLLDGIAARLAKLKIDGLICIGGDGTLNGMQGLAERIPTVLAPKTIDNDLGLNYPSEPDHWIKSIDPNTNTEKYTVKHVPGSFDQNHMVNYTTPGYATAVYVAATGLQRIRTTAESHRRIAIVEVMGRHSGYIALGTCYGQPDILLVPEIKLDVDHLVDRVLEIYSLQKNVVILCAEGIEDTQGNPLGAEKASTDPAGNLLLTGAAEALRSVLIDRIGDEHFVKTRRETSAKAAIFTRKVGHTQRGGRPILFDRYHASQLGAHAVDLLMQGQNNVVACLQFHADQGFYLASYSANSFRDRWNVIHARRMHPDFYDAKRLMISRTGANYLMPIFKTALGHDDVEHIRQTVFDSGNLFQPYHSVNTDVNKRIRFLPTDGE